MGTELVEQNTVSDQTSDPCQPKRTLSVKENAVIGTEHCYYSTSGTEDCQWLDHTALSVKKNTVNERKHCHENRTLLLVEQNTVSDQTIELCQSKRTLSVKGNTVMGAETLLLMKQNNVSEQIIDPYQSKRTLLVKENTVMGTKHHQWYRTLSKIQNIFEWNIVRSTEQLSVGHCQWDRMLPVRQSTVLLQQIKLLQDKHYSWHVLIYQDHDLMNNNINLDLKAHTHTHTEQES